jgi:subtilisin
MARRVNSSLPKYMEERPKQLVIFRTKSEQNATVVSKVQKVAEAKNISARASCTVFASKAGVHTRLYDRLAVAVGNFNDDEVAELRKSQNVVDVVPNELRMVPPIQLANAAASVEPFGSISGLPSLSPYQAYLFGMRDAIDAMLRFESLRTGQPALPIEPASLPSPRLQGQIGTSQIGSSMSWCLEMIGIGTDTVFTGKGATVAVLDTGVDLTHPDFNARFTEGENAVSFIEGESVQDGNGHGTHCVGVVGGPVVSSSGRRYGVAPNANVLVGKVLSDAGSGFDDQILDGIDWAMDQGAQIISMSLGSERAVGEPFPQQYERIAQQALERDVLIIAAAGNSSDRPVSRAPVENPASCPSIMSVAAVDRFKRVASFSCARLDSIGDLDISGPGVAVHSSWTGGGFRTISGTSMATPHVAGIAALYREKDPGLTGRDLWNLLLSNAILLGASSDFGRGLARVPK